MSDQALHLSGTFFPSYTENLKTNSEAERACSGAPATCMDPSLSIVETQKNRTRTSFRRAWKLAAWPVLLVVGQGNPPTPKTGGVSTKRKVIQEPHKRKWSCGKVAGAFGDREEHSGLRSSGGLATEVGSLVAFQMSKEIWTWSKGNEKFWKMRVGLGTCIIKMPALWPWFAQ